MSDNKIHIRLLELLREVIRRMEGFLSSNERHPPGIAELDVAAENHNSIDFGRLVATRFARCAGSGPFARLLNPARLPAVRLRKDARARQVRVAGTLATHNRRPDHWHRGVDQCWLPCSAKGAAGII